jgi:uncharacterized protein
MDGMLAHFPTDPVFYAVGLVTVFIMALSKGAFGGGIALVGVPLLSLVVDPLDASVMVAILVVAMDVFALRAFPMKTWSRIDLKFLLPGLIVGIGLGWIAFVTLDPRIVALMIAVTTLAFTAHWFLKGRLAGGEPKAASARRGVWYGTLAGFATFIAHSAAPPLAMYLVPRRLDKTVFAGTNVLFFAVANIIKIFPYVAIAMTRPQTFAMSLALVPAIPIGVWIGRRLHNRLDQNGIYFWCYLLIGLAGTKLLYDSIRALAG